MSADKYKPRLFEEFKKDIVPLLLKKLKLNNTMEVPKITKIKLNMGIGDAKDSKNSLNQAINELSTISGQKAVVTKAKKAISNFKIRQGDPVGVSVTLRNDIMYEFLDRFISVSSPRIRDFRGFSGNSFDGRGNYNFGITEQIIFPEIDYDKVNQIRGLNITIVTSTNDDAQAYELLKHFGFPLNEMKKTKASLNKETVSEVEEVSEAEEVTPEAEEVSEAEDSDKKSNLKEDENSKNKV